MKACLAALFAALIASSLAASSGFAAGSPPTPQPTRFNEVASAPAQAVVVVSDDYAIGPQDTLEITVFQVADLSKTVRVESNGAILLPLIGQMNAGGRNPKQLSDDIAAELSKSYMKDPQVTVTVKESASLKVTVDGAVVQPGIYPISGKTTLMQAIALARGPTELANLKEVAIFRSEGTRRLSALFDLSSIRDGKMADPAVMANDVIVVETSRGKAFLRNLTAAIPILQLFRPY
jgi:polysaccharide export outer membrane protein